MTLDLDKELVERARELTGSEDLTALVHASLEALIASAAVRRLVMMGGSQPGLSRVPRRRPAK